MHSRDSLETLWKQVRSLASPSELKSYPLFYLLDMADYLVYDVDREYDSDVSDSHVARAEVDRAATLLIVWIAIWWSMCTAMLYFLLM